MRWARETAGHRRCRLHRLGRRGLLLDAGHEVVVLDDLSTGHRDAVPDGAEFVQAGVAQADQVLSGAGFDAVLHFAAKSLVAESVARPELYWSNNVVGSLRLLRAMRDAGVHRLVFSSTAATYGMPDASPITEDTPAVPTNPYGQTKLAIDHAIAGEAAAHGLAAVSLRYFNVGGSYAGLGERHDPETHLIPNILAVPAGRREAVERLRYGLPDPRRHCRPRLPACQGSGRCASAGTGRRRCRRAPDLQPRHRDGIHRPRGGRGVPAGDRPSGATRRTATAALVTRRRWSPLAERAKADLGWEPRQGLERIVADAWSFVRR